jgi:hypothetical protein
MTIDLELPPGRRPFPAARRVTRRQEAERAVRHLQSRPRWRRPAVLGGLGVAVVATVGAAGIYVAQAPATKTNDVRCYTASNSSADYKGTEATEATSSTGEQLNLSPVEVCAALWQTGVITAGAQRAELPPGGTFDVPELQACVLKSGQAAVFPGPPGLCPTLGLPALQEAPR